MKTQRWNRPHKCIQRPNDYVVVDCRRWCALCMGCSDLYNCKLYIFRWNVINIMSVEIKRLVRALNCGAFEGLFPFLYTFYLSLPKMIKFKAKATPLKMNISTTVFFHNFFFGFISQFKKIKKKITDFLRDKIITLNNNAYRLNKRKDTNCLPNYLSQFLSRLTSFFSHF